MSPRHFASLSSPPSPYNKQESPPFSDSKNRRQRSTSPVTRYLDRFGDPLSVSDLDLSFSALKDAKSSSPREKSLERLRRIKGLVPYVNLKRLDISDNVF